MKLLVFHSRKAQNLEQNEPLVLSSGNFQLTIMNLMLLFNRTQNKPQKCTSRVEAHLLSPNTKAYLLSLKRRYCIFGAILLSSCCSLQNIFFTRTNVDHFQIEALTDENCQLTKKLELTLAKLEAVLLHLCPVSQFSYFVIRFIIEIFMARL